MRYRTLNKNWQYNRVYGRGKSYVHPHVVLYVAKNLVDHPDAVSVTQTEGEDGTLLELRVASEDMGKVIGRQGRIAKEIRTIVKTVAQRNGERITVDIVD